MPALSEQFFKSKIPQNDSLCPFGLMYSCILQPEIAQLASRFSNMALSRGEREAQAIRACRSPQELLALLKGGIDPLNYDLLIARFLEAPDQSIPLLIRELQTRVSDQFVELSIRILGLSDWHDAGVVMEIITGKSKTVYQVAMLCLLLGFQQDIKVMQFLWNNCVFLQSRFPNETFWRGPLYGLWELWAWRNEQILGAGSALR